MPTDDAAPPPERTKTPIDQWFELCVYAPLGLALDARQLLPRFIDRGRSQVALARVVGRYAVRRGSTRAGAVMQTLGLIGEEAAPEVAQTDLDDFDEEVVVFEHDARDAAVPQHEPAHEPAHDPDREEPPPVATLAIPDYDNLSASQVVPRLGGLSAAELDAVGRYEAATRGRKTILNKVAQLRSA